MKTMNRKALVLRVLLILAFFGIGFSLARSVGVIIEKIDTPLSPLAPTPTVGRYIDDDAGVICYVVTRGIPTAAWGISCLPIGDTWLGEDDGR